MTKETKFLSSFQSALKIFEKHVYQGSTIRIVTHNDADGLSSGGILSAIAYRKRVPFKITCHKKLDENTLKHLTIEQPNIVIFSDFGSGYLQNIKKAYEDSDIIIFDHHLLEKVEPPENIIHINPLIQEIDGSREIASSGICYLFAKAINPDNIDLCCLGLVGALGDQQDKGKKKSLIGLNKIIEKESIEKGYLQKNIGLTFYGYETRPLSKAISYTTTPFIPGLSGNESNCTAFLKDIGISLTKDNKQRSLADLNEKEKRILFSAISNHLVSQGYKADVVHQLIGTIYTFKLEKSNTAQRNGREYASLLNACGRMERTSLGISICLGDRGEAINEAQHTLEDYRIKISNSLDWLQKTNAIKELDYIYVIQAGKQVEETVIGVVSSIILGNGKLNVNKPIISTAIDYDGQIKISARGTEAILNKNIHLGEIMQRAAGYVNGGGGGHDVAAGAFISLERENEFLEIVNRIVGEHIVYS
jgi:RecJ-like exonuclease